MKKQNFKLKLKKISKILKTTNFQKNSISHTKTQLCRPEQYKELEELRNKVNSTNDEKKAIKEKIEKNKAAAMAKRKAKY